MAKMREQIDQEQTSESPATKTDRRRRPRITLAVEHDGTIDTSGLTEEQIERLRAALEPPEAPEPIQPAVIHFALSALCRIEAAIVGPRFGVPADQALQAFTPPAEMAAAISDAGARVLSKYSGALGRWQDEIALGALLVTWQSMAFSNLRELAAARQQAPAPAAAPKARAERPAPSAPAAPEAPERIQWPEEPVDVLTD